LTEEVKVELFLRKATGLVKEIGPGASFILPWAGMAGSGITFYSIYAIYYYPQGSVPLSFLIVGVPCILNAAIIAMLAVYTPRSAGGYVWSSRFVDPFLGWFAGGWIYWFSYILTIALLAYVMGTVFPTIFAVIGSATKFTALVNFAMALSVSGTMQDEFIILMIVIIGFVSLIELKHFIRVMIVVWALNVLGLIVSCVLFATNNPGTIPSAWNAVWGAGSYETITSLCTKYDLSSYVSSTSGGFWADTLSMIVYIFWAISGYETMGYVAGEVRNPRTSFLYLYMAGMITTVLWYAAVAGLAYNAYGNFILQYSYVQNLYAAGKLTAAEAAQVTPYMFTPSMPVFSASLTTVPILQILAAWWFWPITLVLGSYMVCARSMFGMSFDRMFPAVFGDVNDRTHTPVKATLFTILVSIIFAGISFTYWGYLVTAANTVFWTALFYLIYSAAAIMLPYKRPDIWDKGIIKKVGGIPLVTILGALSAMGMLWLLALSTIGISLTAWNVSEVWMILGILIFVYYTRKNSKRGISVASIFGEVPPP
jgi:APA family basic amino acid/polyamine antiporter